MYALYKDFSEEYLKKEYKPNVSAFKRAIEMYDLKPDIFNKEDHLLSKKEQLQKELFMIAYQEVERIRKEKENAE